jgi:hypothetical protein
VLHHARGTSVHRELRMLADEVARDLGIVPATSRAQEGDEPEPRSAELSRSSGGLKATLLRGLGRGR